MSISSPFIKRPVATSLLAAAFLLVGVVCYFQLPVSALPQVDFPTIQVQAGLPGASPETMASNVAAPLERQLSQIPGLTQITSGSQLGVGHGRALGQLGIAQGGGLLSRQGSGRGWRRRRSLSLGGLGQSRVTGLTQGLGRVVTLRAAQGVGHHARRA